MAAPPRRHGSHRHYNAQDLHRSARRRRPGAGPIGSERIEPTCSPQVVRREEKRHGPHSFDLATTAQVDRRLRGSGQHGCLRASKPTSYRSAAKASRRRRRRRCWTPTTCSRGSRKRVSPGHVPRRLRPRCMQDRLWAADERTSAFFRTSTSQAPIDPAYTAAVYFRDRREALLVEPTETTETKETRRRLPTAIAGPARGPPRTGESRATRRLHAGAAPGNSAGRRQAPGHATPL